LREVADYFLVHEIRSEELIVGQKFLEESQLAGYVAGYDIVEDELEPFGDMHFEEIVVADELTVDVVESIVELHELLTLVVLVREDVLLQIHLHEVQQLEQQLRNTQVLANHLAHTLRED
jgi:hypothetical protein